jgi:hypothetical protein
MVERWFLDFLRLSLNARRSALRPPILGIIEHFLSRRNGYAMTFCDIKGAASMMSCLSQRNFAGKLSEPQRASIWFRAVCMDLASVYDSRCANTFQTPASWPIASTSSVHFLASWKELDPGRMEESGVIWARKRYEQLLSLMRRNLRLDQQARLRRI